MVGLLLRDRIFLWIKKHAEKTFYSLVCLCVNEGESQSWRNLEKEHRENERMQAEKKCYLVTNGRYRKKMRKSTSTPKYFICIFYDLFSTFSLKHVFVNCDRPEKKKRYYDELRTISVSDNKNKLLILSSNDSLKRRTSVFFSFFIWTFSKLRIIYSIL